MKVLTAINNEKIFEQLKNENNIEIISNDIQYKEGILEILEKNKNINYIIINENLYGQIKIEELIKKIKNINKKINIIIILNKKDLIKEKYLINNKINFIYNEELNLEKIINKIFNKNKIIAITGNQGVGKTITTILIGEIIAKYKNKKILVIEDNIKNNSILKIYKAEKEEKNKTEKNKTIKLKNNLYLLNIKKILINNMKNKIKNTYNYIFIHTQNFNSLKIYQEIINENILILNSNILEINKIKKYIINNKNKLKIILNNYNENSISEKILNKIFNNKIKIIEKIENNKKYNLIINNNLDINYLDKKTINKYLKIIKNI